MTLLHSKCIFKSETTVPFTVACTDAVLAMDYIANPGAPNEDVNLTSFKGTDNVDIEFVTLIGEFVCMYMTGFLS